MKECWVNVYDMGIAYAFGASHSNLWEAKLAPYKKPLYRIHVKMKEPKPKIEPKKYYTKDGWSWMNQ